MYSAADARVDAAALDALVAARGARAWRAQDAPHVGLLRTHRAAYVRELRAVNEWGVNAWRRKRGLPEWRIPPDAE